MKSVEGSLILGGGLAGSMAALELARAGRRVTILEKSKEPHDKVCGEFLSGESVQYLDRQGVDLSALGAVSIRSVRLLSKDIDEEAELPFPAWSLTRRRLDEEMLRLATRAGVKVSRGAYVCGLDKSGSSWRIDLRDGQNMLADDVFLATGKHDLRGWRRPEGTHRGLVAFKMYYRLAAEAAFALDNAVELILFPGGYAGLQPVEGGAANLCLLIDSHRLQNLESGWAGVQDHFLKHSSHLEARLRGAVPLLKAPLTAAQIPYGHVQRRTEDGLWRIGDQAAVIPSFCGDGMAIALHSATLAAFHLLSGLSADTYQRRLRKELAGRIWAATKLSQMMVAFPQALRLIGLFPALLPAVALMTRIPEHALMTERSLCA